MSAIDELISRRFASEGNYSTAFLTRAILELAGRQDQTDNRLDRLEATQKDELSEALKMTGFAVCEFGPDNNDPCECCKKTNVQLYFQGPCDAGRYYCADCIIKEYRANVEYGKKMEDRPPTLTAPTEPGYGG